MYIGLVDTNTAGFFPGIGSMLEQLVQANNNNGNEIDEPVKLGALTNAAVAYAEAVMLPLLVYSESAENISFVTLCFFPFHTSTSFQSLLAIHLLSNNDDLLRVFQFMTNVS